MKIESDNYHKIFLMTVDAIETVDIIEQEIVRERTNAAKQLCRVVLMTYVWKKCAEIGLTTYYGNGVFSNNKKNRPYTVLITLTY